MDLADRAREFATKAHEGVFRRYGDDVPYITHPQHVAERVAQLNGKTEFMVAAAWLHDVVEDTEHELRDIRHEFGPVVAALVAQLTNPSKQHPDLSRAERKAMDREHIAVASEPALQIKMVDRAHNLSTIATDAEEDFARLYLYESQLLALAMHDAMDHDDLDSLVLGLELAIAINNAAIAIYERFG